MKRISIQGLAILLGMLGLTIEIVMLYFRPHESWYDDAFWADWGFRLSQGEFVSTVWGGGKPSYSPLYALMMALWYKLLGFSYFTAQLPNLLFAFLAYLVIVFRLDGGTLLRSKWSLLALAFGYWASDSLFGIFTCGRVDTLCLLLGLLTIESFARAFENRKVKDVFLLCVWSAFQMATGFEGVLFTVIVILIYGVLQWRKALHNWTLYLYYAISSIVSLGGVLLYMASHDCAKAFIRTTFGFSYTIQGAIHFFETGKFSFDTPVPIDDRMTLRERIDSLTIDGLMANREYGVLLIIVIILVAIVLYRKELKNLSSICGTMIVAGILAPWVYIVAGRYAWYYTWAAYVPILVSFCVLIEKVGVEKIVSSLLCIGMCLWFTLSPEYKDRKRLDFRHVIDEQNLCDIRSAGISPRESTYIPYKWYYYLAPTNNKLYFEGSGSYPKDMTKMVLSSPKEVEYWGNILELEYQYKVGSYGIYRVLGEKSNGFLR